MARRKSPQIVSCSRPLGQDSRRGLDFDRRAPSRRRRRAVFVPQHVEQLGRKASAAQLRNQRPAAGDRPGHDQADLRRGLQQGVQPLPQERFQLAPGGRFLDHHPLAQPADRVGRRQDGPRLAVLVDLDQRAAVDAGFVRAPALRAAGVMGRLRALKSVLRSCRPPNAQ